MSTDLYLKTLHENRACPGIDRVTRIGTDNSLLAEIVDKDGEP